MKSTNEDNVQIYELRNRGYSFKRLSNQFEANIHGLKFIKSKDKTEIVRESVTEFSLDIFLKII